MGSAPWVVPGIPVVEPQARVRPGFERRADAECTVHSGWRAGGHPQKEVSHEEQGWVRADWERGPGRTWGQRGGLDRPQLPPSRTGGHACAVLLGRAGRAPSCRLCSGAGLQGPTRCPWLSGDNLQVGAPSVVGLCPSLQRPALPCYRRERSPPQLSPADGGEFRAPGPSAASTPAPMLNDFLKLGVPCRMELRSGCRTLQNS